MKIKWNNRVTQILGSQYPIMLGAMQGIGKSTLAASVSEAGGFGIITAHCFRKPEKLRNDIRKAKSMTSKPFGVNFSIGLVRDMDAMLDVALDEGIKVIETSVMPGKEYLPKIREAGAKWIHKVACVEHALSWERQGADAVIIVGMEGIGFKHVSQLPTLIGITWAVEQMKIPVIAAGGIGNGRTFAAALGMGAEGICMGTMFVATEECPVGKRHKRSLVDAKPSDPLFRNQALNPPDMSVFEEVMKDRGNMPMEEWLKRLEKVMLQQSPDKPYEAQEMAGGSLAVGFIDGIVPVKELIDTIVSDTEEILLNQIPNQFPPIDNM
ncbi:MAG: nitronate monooxygenase [Dehalococcoidia bacterium]|nr:nitronate monooxygenase [Dehalococcoidia bacterium]